MQYRQVLDYLYEALPMFSRTGAKALKPGLENISRLCSFLGNPHHQLKMIHVAGTNGKGSVCHMLTSVLMENGYKTGLYTSPHLIDFRERIRINGDMVTERFVIDFVERLKPFIDEHKPSFFEITVGMALDYFAQESVDVAIIETGLGGRLDSTNIITPLLSVITNIGMDHTDILGDTPVKIASEKAGIIKSGIPVVIGEYSNDTRAVFEEAAVKNQSPILFAADRFSILSVFQTTHLLEAEVFDHKVQQKESYVLDLPGLYQQFNLMTVLAALTFLENHFSLSRERVQSALSSVRKLTGFQGRWEIVRDSPQVVLDVAHNAEGMRALLHNISLQKYHHLHLIMGMVKDKPVNEVLLQLPAKARYYFTQAHIPRAMPAAEFEAKARAFGLEGTVYSNVNTAIKAAMQTARADDLIVICGSVFLIGEVDRTLFLR